MLYGVYLAVVGCREWENHNPAVLEPSVTDRNQMDLISGLKSQLQGTSSVLFLRTRETMADGYVRQLD